MAPLLVLISTTGVVFVISAATSRSLHGHWTTPLRGGLAAMFAVTGTTHFVVLRDDLIAMVPPALPAPGLLVTLTGILELAGAIGLLWRPTARWSAVGLTGLLVAVFPANVYAALSGSGLNGEAPTPLGVRTVIQIMFIAAAVAVWAGLRRDGRSAPPERRDPARPVVTLPPAHGSAHPSCHGVVMVSRLKLRSLRDVPGFLRAALRLRRAFRTAAGAITLRLAASPLAGTFWTWSSWADEPALQEYTRSRLHLGVMRSYRTRMRSSTFHILDPAQVTVPTTWAEVRALTGSIRPDSELPSDRSHAATGAGRTPEQEK
ncbi:DoxX family protein [Geodermatophilus normandii]|uniref:DoxX family membrane protein n=1 Tax=Geodermatophilus normandii TaxID=1137989 RepID=A0A6P0GLR7_9ACTN|nr:DoxX family membrane protein [Geodermatophilus normandii]NEM08325.1 DoxX family membrane protein [Geodermatophilus normandii]